MSFDFNPLPKTFCDQYQIGFGKEHFAFALLSGTAASTFAMTPSLSKSLLQTLAAKIAEHEKTYGTIDPSPSGIPSMMNIEPKNEGPIKGNSKQKK